MHSSFKHLIKNFSLERLQSLDLVGYGAYGRVFKLDEKSVIKAVDKLFLLEEEYCMNDSVLKEICFLKQYCHKNIIKLLDFNIQYDYILLHLEYGGISLSKWISNNSFEVRCKYLPHIFNQLVDVLIYLEKLNIVHNDLKPDNIVINPETLEVKVIDWGSVSFRPECRKNNYCTLKFAPPENLDNNIKVCSKSDIFSLSKIVKYIVFNSYDDVSNYDLHVYLKEYCDESFIDIITKISIEDHEKRLSASNITQTQIYNTINDPSIDIVIQDYRNKLVYIKEDQRKILLNWIFEVCCNFEILNCYSLTVWIIDKYLSLRPDIKINKFQLVGVSSLILSDIFINDGNNFSLQIGSELCNEILNICNIENMICYIFMLLKGKINRKLFDIYIKDVDYEIVKNITLDMNYMSKTNDDNIVTYYNYKK